MKSATCKLLLLLLGLCAGSSLAATPAPAPVPSGFAQPGSGLPTLPVPFVGVTVPIASIEARAPRYAYFFIGAEPDPALIASLRASVRRGSTVQLLIGPALSANTAVRALAREFPVFVLRGELRSSTLITDVAVYIGGLRGREAGTVITDPSLSIRRDVQPQTYHGNYMCCKTVAKSFRWSYNEH